MDESTRLNLSKLVKEYKPEETTQKIRKLKHSDKIKQDISTFVKLKHKYYRLDQKTKKKMYETQCNFLFTNYTNIYNKLINYIQKQNKTIAKSLNTISFFVLYYFSSFCFYRGFSNKCGM